MQKGLLIKTIAANLVLDDRPEVENIESLIEILNAIFSQNFEYGCSYAESEPSELLKIINYSSVRAFLTLACDKKLNSFLKTSDELNFIQGLASLDIPQRLKICTKISKLLNSFQIQMFFGPVIPLMTFDLPSNHPKIFSFDHLFSNVIQSRLRILKFNDLGQEKQAHLQPENMLIYFIYILTESQIFSNFLGSIL